MSRFDADWDSFDKTFAKLQATILDARKRADDDLAAFHREAELWKNAPSRASLRHRVQKVSEESAQTLRARRRDRKVASRAEARWRRKGNRLKLWLNWIHWRRRQIHHVVDFLKASLHRGGRLIRWFFRLN